MDPTQGKYQLISPLSAEEMAALEKDCKDRGILVPVELDEDGNVLDGHNRVAIAERHGLKYKTVVRHFKTEVEKKAHVLLLNMARRQMKSHQWGSAFKMLLELRGVKRGTGTRNDTTGATVAQVAEELGVPHRTAKKRLELADAYESLPTDEKEAVDRGEKSVSSAARKDKQSKKRKEAGRTAKLSGKASVYLGDPPWLYGAGTVTGGADQHYATMSTEEICALPVRDHVTKDAVLFLWTTNPLLPDALRVVEAWGFAYKTNLVWVKDKAASGLGEYVRGRHELLLIATRGTMIPEKSKRPDSVIEVAKGKHSKKPASVYAMIERMYPGQVYMEMFSRGAPRGWKAWGAEASV